MNNRISYAEYERRVFNAILTECFVKLHSMANGLDEKHSALMESFCSDKKLECPKYRAEMAAKMAKEFFKSELDLNKSTIRSVKNKLSECTSFVKDCIAIAEACAREKAEAAADAKLELTDDDDGEDIEDEERSEIEKLFDAKTPTTTADVVARTTVDALIDEKKKSEEVKDAIDLAKAAGDSKKLEETVVRMSRRGPTSLMNAIMTFVSECAVNDVNNNTENGVTSIGEVLKENAEEIRTRSAMMYSLYETMNAFGFKRYTEDELRDAAWSIYEQKD